MALTGMPQYRPEPGGGAHSEGAVVTVPRKGVTGFIPDWMSILKTQSGVGLSLVVPYVLKQYCSIAPVQLQAGTWPPTNFNHQRLYFDR